MTIQETPMTKEQVIAKMVGNYYRQARIVGSTTLTLEEYLRGIFDTAEPGDNPYPPYTEADLVYGLLLSVEK